MWFYLVVQSGVVVVETMIKMPLRGVLNRVEQPINHIMYVPTYTYPGSNIVVSTMYFKALITSCSIYTMEHVKLHAIQCFVINDLQCFRSSLSHTHTHTSQ